MKPYIIVGGIGVAIVLLCVLFYAVHTSEQKKTVMNETQLQKNALALMTVSDKEMQEAQTLLSKKNSTEQDQMRALQLLQHSIDDAKKATAAQPKNPEAWDYLSELYMRLVNVNSKAAVLAEDALNHAVQLDPKNAILYGNRATTLIYQKKYSEAEKDLNKALELQPSSANYYYKLGNVYQAMGQKEKARDAYLVAKKLIPSTSKVDMAQINYQLQQLDKASESATSATTSK